MSESSEHKHDSDGKVADASSGTSPYGGLAWYASLGAMALFDFIDWPIALVIGITHAIESDSDNRLARQLAGGVEAGV